MENNTSTGNVSHILRDFRKNIGESSVDETIEFARLVRKSGMTMAGCIEGLRMSKLMDKLGFNTNEESKDFQDFINKIYFPCKDLGIQPKWIFSWIADLLVLTEKLKRIQPHNSIYVDSKNTKEGVNFVDDPWWNYQKLNAGSRNSETDYQPPPIYLDSVLPANISTIDKTDSSGHFTESPSLNSTPSDTNRVILVSDIVDLISKVQNRGNEVCNYYQRIKRKTIEMKNTSMTVRDNLRKTITRNIELLHFEKWFYRAKQQLWDLYGIRIETDLPKFIKLLDEFSRHHYDPYEIINDYVNRQSIDNTIAENNNIIEGQKKQTKTLQGKITYAESWLENYKITEGNIEKLDSIGFKIDDLIRIYNVMVETASLKNVPVQNIVNTFVNDVEKNYYNYLLYSDLANKRKREYIDLIKTYSYYGTSFEENLYCKAVLSQLLNRGISQENIININSLLVEITRRNLYFKNMKSNDKIKQNDIEKVNITNNYNALIADLRKYVTLDIACAEKQRELDEKINQISLYDRLKQSQTVYFGKVFSYTYISRYTIPYNLP